uniref:CSON006343 protein n=1 Tax=Culicoides sonorensis TaxID=179676 RepID=A0A336MXE7_CULSO
MDHLKVTYRIVTFSCFFLELTWLPPLQDATVPEKSVQAGTDHDGSKIYVGRAQHAGSWLVAKVIPRINKAYVGYDRAEILVTNYEVLVGDKYSWVKDENGNVPENAFIAGTTGSGNGEPLYVGRGHYERSLTPGKIHKSHGCLYIPFGGTEHEITQYEVLVKGEPEEKKKEQFEDWMNFTWVPSSPYAGIPGNAVHAGNDQDGSPIYVGRARHAGDLIVAKVIPSKQAAYVAYNMQEILVTSYEVLVGDGFSWVGSGNGHVPENAVIAGHTSNGEPLYVGRAHHDGSLTPGKIHKSHGCLYIPFGGSEVSIRTYEVLVAQMKPQWRSANASTCYQPNTISGGRDADGAEIFVGRAYHEGDLIPAKVIPSKQVAYVPYNGEEIAKYDFEMLCGGHTAWVQSSYGNVPHNAVRGGHTSSGEPLYIGRAHWAGSLTVGKIHPSHQALYIPFGGSEVPIKNNYEVLIEY